MEEYLVLPELVSSLGGAYQFHYSPTLLGIVNAFDDPAIPEVVTQKPAQIGYTNALIGFLGRVIDRDPGPIVMLFADLTAAREFVDEKLAPLIEASPILAAAMKSPEKSKRTRVLFQRFPGGFIKLGGSKSVRTVKSTPAQIVIVEEPDDAEKDLKGQGDAIKLLYQRAKRARHGGKRILGGTPSISTVSRVEKHIATSDKCVFPVKCHNCQQSHVLDFDHVRWPDKKTHEDPISPDEVFYECPHCSEPWSDLQRQDNVRSAALQGLREHDPLCGWTPTAPFRKTRGFHRFSDLYSCLPGSGLAEMVHDYLDAQHRREAGDETAWIVFVNSVLGLPYAYSPKSEVTISSMRQPEDYPENELPHGALMWTCGIDVQHDRVAVVRRAWGPGAESWLLYWGEFAAETTTIDTNDPVWSGLDTFVYSALQSVDGWRAYPEAVTIDSGDGVTTDAVYAWVREMRRKHRSVLTMAGKGSTQIKTEIFTRPPQSAYIDHRNPSKADRMGLKIYTVGTHRAKDWIYGKLTLAGDGAGRWHWYRTCRSDYQSQLLSETKAPSRTGSHVYMLRPGARNEALDCEVYSLHAAYSKRVHLMSPKSWDALLAKRRQLDLSLEPGESDAEESLGSILSRMK